MKRLMMLGIVGGAFWASAAIPTGAGPYNWADYLSTKGGRVDARPDTELTADQTWVVEEPRTAGPFYPGVKTLNDYWQIWTGESVTVTNDGFRVMMGNVVFENEVISKTRENYIGYTGPVKLLLRKGGSLHVTSEPLRIGRVYNNGTAGTATVFMEEPSTLSAASTMSIDVGDTLPGTLWMDGGTVSLTNAIISVGKNSAGYLRQNGGTISVRGLDDKPSLDVGENAAYSSLHVSGGVLTSRRSYNSAHGVRIGSLANTVADFYADGGSIQLAGERFMVGAWEGSAERATLTVDGTAEMQVGILAMGVSGTGTSALNLNGGWFKTDKGLANYGNTAPTRQVNFDGGTFEGEIADYPTIVYPGGGSIHVPASRHSYTFKPRLATGYGVAAITLTAPGAGYVTVPQVTISGGSGSGATAYAVLAKDRTVARIVVTCRGEGYAADDVLTVTISSTTGTGAAATVTLAANGTGTLHKVGGGVWHQTADSDFAGDICVDEGAIAVDGAKFTALRRLTLKDGAALNTGRSGTAGTTRDAAVNRVHIQDAVGSFRTYGDAGTGCLTIGTLNLERGLALISYTNGLALALTDDALTSASSTTSPIVHGLVYKNLDAAAYRSPSLFERAADGSLSLIETTDQPTEGANFCPSVTLKDQESSAPTVSSLNCAILPLTPTVEYYVKNTGLVEIKSGMMIYRRPQVNECLRFAVTGGGAFTTRAPGGMMIYGDNHQIGLRSCNTADVSIDGRTYMRRIFGPFADPDATTPMALTVAGERQGRPEHGTVVWLLNNNSYSGGLNLLNGGVFIGSENVLGAVGSPIHAAGFCSIAAYQYTFNISAHPVSIAEEGVLIFSPEYGNSGNTIASSLSGAGDLMTSDVNRSGYAMAFTGDHSAFTGDYYIQGHARIAPSVFSTVAGICLADGTNGVGVIETSGTIDRAPGTGKGELCWKRHTCYSTSYGLRGGFAAKGGDLTVNLGGDARKLVCGSAYLPENAVVQLQSQYADGALTLANGFELGGLTQKVSVWGEKTATISGAVSDAVGGGQLAVMGNLAFAGTLEATGTNLAVKQPLLAVGGKLDLTGAKIDVRADADTLAAYKSTGVALATATGAITGTPTFKTPLPGAWSLRVKEGALLLTAVKGTVILVR